LKKNTVQNKLIKWETKKWGEIPADFGRKWWGEVEVEVEIKN
jgi:hypothetical protein